MHRYIKKMSNIKHVTYSPDAFISLNTLLAAEEREREREREREGAFGKEHIFLTEIKHIHM